MPIEFRTSSDSKTQHGPDSLFKNKNQLFIEQKRKKKKKASVKSLNKKNKNLNKISKIMQEVK